MALPENLTLKDIFKYPRQAILYMCLCGAGYLANKLIPDDKDRQISYLKQQLAICQQHSDATTAAYITSLKEKNTIIENQTFTLKAVDSVLVKIYKKALTQK